MTHYLPTQPPDPSRIILLPGETVEQRLAQHRAARDAANAKRR